MKVKLQFKKLIMEKKRMRDSQAGEGMEEAAGGSQNPDDCSIF